MNKKFKNAVILVMAAVMLSVPCMAFAASKSGGVKTDVVSIAASVLGISKDELKASLQTGKIGDLLLAAGKLDEFKTAYLSAVKSKLDAAVADGSLTQEKADEKYAAAQAKMAAYDGTEHLCGGKGHHGKKEKTEKTE
ncbi:MAG: hypothetical protein LBT44_08385 [Clostridiales bacterium]|jgi:hypothetical protein|nr:hypothetical protein [Clostridiales bacterium]